jgi:hypothetical protein
LHCSSKNAGRAETSKNGQNLRSRSEQEQKIKNQKPMSRWDITDTKNIMRVAYYVFPNENSDKSYESRNAVADKIYYNCGGYSAYETSNYDSDGYGLYILSDCTDVSSAVKYCEGNGGVRRNF